MTAQITIDFAELNAHAAKQHAKPREHAKGSRSELVRLKTGTPGFLKYDDRRGVGNMNTLVAGRFYMRVNGTNVKSRDMLIGLMEAWDVAGLRRTAGPAEWRREPIGPLRTARRDYRAGKLGAAFVALEHAATVMARRRAFELAKTIPGAPPGWRVVSTKSTIDGKSRAGRVVVFTRTLAPAPQSAGGSRGKTLSISLNVGRASMMRVIRRLKASSRFNPKAPARKIAVEGAGYATLRYNPERGYGSIHAFVGKTAYLSATGFRLDGPAPLERIMESWNIAALKRALGE